jgi:hypothetical protein
MATARIRGGGNGKDHNKIPPMTPAEMELAILGRGAVDPTKIEKVVITPPRMQIAELTIRGFAPYVQHAFSQKAQTQIEETQRAGTQARSRKKRSARDFEADYKAAQHRSKEGWLGIPSPAFRNAMIDACRLVGFVMTKAKLSVFVLADGWDAEDGGGLVRITEGEPRIHKSWGRNANGGADLRWRPMWEEGWGAKVRVRWDLDQFSASDVFNLMCRAGLQVGIGEGRPSSPNSNGLDWGLFEVVSAS